jgi:biotin operon repressor
VTNLDQLTDDLTGTLRRNDTDVTWLQPVVIRLLADGNPVSVEQLADATGRSHAKVRAALAAMRTRSTTRRAASSAGGSLSGRPRIASPSTATRCSPGAHSTR